MFRSRYDFEDYRDRVVKQVKNTLGRESWFRGVCADTIGRSYDDGKTVDEAADIAADDTAFHDNTDYFPE